MSIAFVLGNGISRRPIEVDVLLKIAPVYACNAVYRTHTPTVLVSTDRPISEEIQNSGYSAKNRFYTRHPIPGLGARSVPQKYRGFSSGPIAVSLAAADYCSPIYLLGFDLGPNDAGKFNNVFAGTEFYKAEGAAPTFTGNWINQIIAVALDYPKHQFIRVMGPTTAEVPAFDKIDNMESISFADFVQVINTLPKDL